MDNLEIFLVAIFILSTNALTYAMADRWTMLLSDYGETNKEINDYAECNNLTLTKTAICLRQYVSTFYNYTVRSDTPRTLDNIKEFGGDCYDYSNLYEQFAKSLGFYGYTYSFKLGHNKGHRIAIIANSDGYCMLDQLNYKCVILSFDE